MLDIVNNQGQLMTLSEIIDIYKVKLNYLDYYSMIAAIPEKWKKAIGMITVNINGLTFVDCCLVEKIVELKKVSKYAYDDLISRVDSSCIIDRWNSVLDKQALDKGFQFGKITQITKYQSFQFRLMHKAIWLNPRLYHSGLSKTKNCSFCQEAKETYQHFFYECQHVKALWNDLDTYFAKEMLQKPNFGYHNVITNSLVDPPYHFINLTCLILKQHIYARKCQNKKPNINMILNEIKFI